MNVALGVASPGGDLSSQGLCGGALALGASRDFPQYRSGLVWLSTGFLCLPILAGTVGKEMRASCLQVPEPTFSLW